MQQPSAPRPTSAAAEPFGQVPAAASTSPHLQHRHPHQQRGSDASYYSASTTSAAASYSAVPAAAPYGASAPSASSGYAYPQHQTDYLRHPPPAHHHHGESKQKRTYQHNTAALVMLVPCIWILLVHVAISPMPATLFLFGLLGLYCLDLANARQGVLVGIWLLALVMTLTCSWCLLIDHGELEYTPSGGGDTYVLRLLLIVTNMALLWIAVACWMTLQLEWMVVTSSSSSATLPHMLEQSLHSLLPPVTSGLVTLAVTNALFGEHGDAESMASMDTAATVAPFCFAGCLFAGMLWIGSCQSSFLESPASATSAWSNDNQYADSSSDKDFAHKSSTPRFVLSTRLARGHIMLLMFTPVLMHVATQLPRMMSWYAGMDDVYDWLLSMAVPYLLLLALVSLHDSDWWPTPYYSAAASSTLASQFLSTSASGGTCASVPAALPILVSLVASWCVQQRYLIPICHSFSYHFMGTQSPAWLISMYFTAATLSLYSSLWLWGRKKTTGSGSGSGEPLFGEYHEDVVQLGLAMTGLTLGKAFGLPWNFTPLPILAFLGLSLWISSRMLRYLLIFLFVLHATGVVVFTYRFAGIQSVITLPLRPTSETTEGESGVDISLTRFGFLTVLASILVGLVAGLAVRSSGGVFAKTFRRLDVTGVVFIVYSILLMMLEITLLKRPVPSKELAGMDYDVDESSEDEMLYENPVGIMTSAVLIGVTAFMKKVKILSARTSWVLISLAIGKAVSVYIDDAEDSDAPASERASGYDVFFRAIVASILCVVMFAPRVFLEPVHLKAGGSHRHRRRSSGSELSAKNFRTISLYAFVFLPIALVVAVPYVLFPFIDALSRSNGGDNYYHVSPPLSELIGAAIALWGLACLSMLNYYLPDGGGEVWKKLSALAFLMGISIFFAAPTLGGNVGEAASNPYASVSSLGSQLITRGRSRTGGWGLLSAALATLLALTGPLELREKRDATGRKDSLLLLRTMVFSLMFGGGVAWFVIMLSMSETEIVYLLMTTVACMTLAFLGTVAAVLGYFLDLDSFEDVEQISKMWMVALPVLGPVSGIPQLFHIAPMHPFGVGGWLSTYLTVAGISAITSSLVLAYRKTKNSTSRGIGNAFCLVAWLCAVVVLYGRYGVSGLDYNFDVTTFFGIPASVLGTFVVSPILLALEGEKARSRGSVQRVSASVSHKASSGSMFQLNLPGLNNANRFWPPVFGTVVVFLCASLYAILLRGSGFFFGGSSVARNHEDVFSTVFGSSGPADQSDKDLASLAEKTLTHSQALMASAQLAGSGFWTSDGFFGPILHLAGVVATFPSIFLMYQTWWLGKAVPMSQVLVTLPLNAIPLLLCRGIPSLRAAAVIGVVGGTIQLMRLRSADHQSKMRI